MIKLVYEFNSETELQKHQQEHQKIKLNSKIYCVLKEFYQNRGETAENKKRYELFKKQALSYGIDTLESLYMHASDHYGRPQSKILEEFVNEKELKEEKMKTIKYKDKELVAYYSDACCGRILNLFDTQKLEKFVCLNITDEQAKAKTSEDTFFLKDYSENEEIAEFLLNNGYLKKLTRSVSSGLVTVHEVEMTPKFKECIVDEKTIYDLLKKEIRKK